MRHLFFSLILLSAGQCAAQSVLLPKSFWITRSAPWAGLVREGAGGLPHTGAWPPPGVLQVSVVVLRRPVQPVGYFCRIEHQLGKRMAMPLKFRLGTVEYVDQLEYPGRWGVK